MTPEMTVTKLVEIMAAMPELSGSPIYKAMQDAGIPYVMGHLAFSFTQNAWGQVFVDGLGIKLCDEYAILEADGTLIETGRSSNNPFFTTARQLAPKYRHTPAFEYMALTSSIVRSVNASLQNGSKPEDLVMMPDVLFLETPTEEGLRKVHQFMSDYASKLRELFPPHYKNSNDIKH